MTTLQKLSLRGVRSYSPHDECIIKFYHPLTIIVGQNGSGKTTIIEALKYICSGELPPLCDKGKSFVHDPDACGEPIVKGQVKLAFQTNLGKPVIAVKSFQLTQQRVKRTFKLIDSVLMTENEEGIQKTMSYKCARMDELMQQLMGVSNAIIENVIFCHQLDANWPLSDDKVLKKKFDDIFAATKYTKALENIKKFRARQLVLSKDLQRDQDVLSHNLEMAQKLQLDLKEGKDRREELENSWRESSAKAESLQEDLEIVVSSLETVSQTSRRLDSLKKQLQTLENERQRARARMSVVYDEDDEASLRNARVKFAAKLKEMQQDAESLQRELASATREDDIAAKRFQNAVKAVGRIEVLQESLEQASQKCEDLRKELVLRHPEAAGDASMDALDLNSMLPLLERLLSAAAERRDSTATSAALILSGLDSRIGEAQARVATQQQLCSSGHERARVLRLQASRARATLSSKKADALALDNVLEQLQNAERELQLQEANVDEQALLQKAEAKTVEMKSVTARLRELSEEQAAASEAARATRQLDVQKQVLQRAECKYEEGVGELRPLLKQSHCRSEQQLIDVDRQKQFDIDEVKGNVEGLRCKRSGTTSRLKALRESLGSLHNTENRLLQSLGADDSASITRKIEECSRVIEDLESDQVLAEFVDDIYSRFISHAKTKHECHMCERSLNEQELQSFVKRNRLYIERQNDPAVKQRKANNLEEMRTQRTALEQLQRTAEELARTRSRIAVEEQDAQKLERLLNDVDEELAALTQKLQRCEQEKQALNVAISVADNVRRLRSEMETARQTLSQHRQQQEQTGSAWDTHTRSVEEIGREYQAAQDRSAELNEEIGRLRREALALDNLTKECKIKRDALQNRARDRDAFLEQIRAIEGEIESCEQQAHQEELTAKRAKVQEEREGEQLQELVRERNRQRQIAAEHKQSLEAQLHELHNDKQRTKDDLIEYERLQCEMNKQRDLQTQAAKLEQDAKLARAKLDDLHAQMERVREGVTTFEGDMRNIDANLDYQERVRAVEALERDVEGCQRSLAESENVQVLQERVERIRKQALQAATRAAEVKGASSSYEEQVKRLEDMLTSDRYSNIESRNRKKMIEVETTRLCVRDLDAYYMALDRALLQYHSLKMKEINNALRELWQTTYRGRDIDYIAIVADRTSTAEGVGAGKQRKQYSYRLVMYRGDIELDMRGRCSAGQRVLASLLIRLALAETFCSKCGILALDEPTLALDSDNVAALADALHALIERRKAHRNFQLILITHDEEFVEMLGKREHAAFYWRVYKDQMQHSRILRVPVRQ